MKCEILLALIYQKCGVLFLLYLSLNSIIISAHDGSIALKYNSSTFNEALKTKSQFVMFFAPWCGHCKRLAPTWEQLAEIYNDNEDKEVSIAKVDCTVEAVFCSEQDITGYPTLKFFKQNENSGLRYRESRSLEALDTFLEDQLKEVKERKPDLPKFEVPNSLTELTEENFKSFVEVGDHFIKFYAPWCGHCQKMASTWEALAEDMKTDDSVKISKIDCTAYRSTCQDFNVKGYPTLLWIRAGKMVERYQGSRNHEDFKEFIIKMKNTTQKSEQEDGSESDTESPVISLVMDTFKNGISSGVTFVKFYAPWCGHCKRLAPVWEEAAGKFINNPNVKMAKVDCTSETNKDLCKEYDIEEYPTLVLFKNGKKQSEYVGSRDVSSLFNYVMMHINREEL